MNEYIFACICCFCVSLIIGLPCFFIGHSIRVTQYKGTLVMVSTQAGCNYVQQQCDPIYAVIEYWSYGQNNGSTCQIEVDEYNDDSSARQYAHTRILGQNTIIYIESTATGTCYFTNPLPSQYSTEIAGLVFLSISVFIVIGFICLFGLFVGIKIVDRYNQYKQNKQKQKLSYIEHIKPKQIEITIRPNNEILL